MKNEQISEHLGELSQTVSHIVAHPLRPLSAFRSLKMKIGILVLGAIATTVFFFWLGIQIGFIWPSLSGIIAAAIALILTRFFAAGLTTPLKEIAQVSKQLSVGDYSQRVRSTSQDEIGALAQTFNAMAEELSRTELLRKELIANASHELKTPLTALQAQLENIVDGIEEPSQEKMTLLLTQTEHLSALVKQLLDLSQLESGVVAFKVSPVAINSVLTSARDVVAPNFPHITFSMEARDVTIEGDFHRLVQVFTNLMTNAASHCDTDGMVRCSMHPKGDSITVYVDDNGPGIDESLRPFVFERFFRADSARNSRDGGAGIGLAISKQIVLMHNGSIAAKKSDLGGARFILTFPTTQSHSHENAVRETIKENKESQLRSPSTKEMTTWHSIPSAT